MQHFICEQDSIISDVELEDIYFIDVNHIANCTVPEIFKASKEVYQYYLHSFFRITTVHVGGEFKLLKNLIESIPGGTLINLAAANEHVPDTKRQIRVVKEWCRVTKIKFNSSVCQSF